MKVFFVNIFLCVTLFLNSQTTYNLDWGLESTNQQITIDVGDTVIWTWSLGFHNLRSTSGVESFDSGYASSGFVFSHTFTTAGITEYVCDVHALAMYGTVIVSSGIVPDYFNDFSTFPGDSWTEAQGSPDVGPSGTTSSWVPDGFGNNGTTGAARVNIYSTFPDEWLISPDFDLSAMTYYLNLDAAATEYFNTSDAIWASDDYAALLVTTDGGATWTEMYRWDANNNPRAAGAAMPEIELTGYGITKFAIYGESTVFDSEDIDFFIDNFSITSSTLGTNDLEVSEFTYFPNPVNDQLTIKAQSDVKDISVYNMLGQLVLRQVPNSLDCVVDMAAMQSGAYFVKVSIGNSVDTIRVLKK